MGIMYKLSLIGDTTAGSDEIGSFISSVLGGVTSKITLAQVGTAVAAIITAGIVAIFAWKFGRKGYNFLKNALSGKNGGV